MTYAINFDCNDGCQLACVMCRPIGGATPKTQRVLPFDLFKSRLLPAIEKALIYQVGCAHEPTLVPYFSDLLMSLPRAHIGRMNTNGVKLTPAFNAMILDSGRFRQIKVSVDGCVASTFEAIRRGARFDQVTKNIARLAKSRLAYQIRPDLVLVFTLQQSNLEEMPRMPELVESLGADGLIIHHVSNDADWCLNQVKAHEDTLKRSRELGISFYSPIMSDWHHDAANAPTFVAQANGRFIHATTHMSFADVGNFLEQDIFELIHGSLAEH